MENLKSCPFCGTKAKIAKTHVRFKKGKTKKIKKTAYAIGCSDPECILYNSGTFSSLYFTVSADSLEYMKRKWNRRTGDCPLIDLTDDGK